VPAPKDSGGGQHGGSSTCRVPQHGTWHKGPRCIGRGEVSAAHFLGGVKRHSLGAGTVQRATPTSGVKVAQHPQGLTLTLAPGGGRMMAGRRCASGIEAGWSQMVLRFTTARPEGGRPNIQGEGKT
jgi:hypothetical protein